MLHFCCLFQWSKLQQHSFQEIPLNIERLNRRAIQILRNLRRLIESKTSNWLIKYFRGNKDFISRKLRFSWFPQHRRMGFFTFRKNQKDCNFVRVSRVPQTRVVVSAKQTEKACLCTVKVNRLLSFQSKVLDAHPGRTMDMTDYLSRHQSESMNNEGKIFEAEELWHNWCTETN